MFLLYLSPCFNNIIYDIKLAYTWIVYYKKIVLSNPMFVLPNICSICAFILTMLHVPNL